MSLDQCIIVIPTDQSSYVNNHTKSRNSNLYKLETQGQQKHSKVWKFAEMDTY